MDALDMRGAWSTIDAKIYNLLVGRALANIFDRMCDRFAPTEGLHAGMRLLDVGCGAGHLVTALGRRYPDLELTGIDLSEEMITRAREATRGLPNVSVSVGDALDLGFPDHSFDFVLSIASIKHWPNRVAGMREIFRVLRPGGQAFVMEIHRNATRAEIMGFARQWRFAAWPLPYVFATYFKRFVTSQGLTADELDAFCSKAGFSVVKPETIENYFSVICTCTKSAA
jgi:ubiquinone/menaquinone biosynthesis C-methylase UbiE